MAEAFKIADAYVEVETRYDNDNLAKSIKDGAEKAEPEIRKVGREQIGRPLGDEGGREAGDRLPKSMVRHFRTTLRAQKPLFMAELIRLGDEGGAAAGKALPKSLVKHFQSELRGKPWMLDALKAEEQGGDVGKHVAGAAARAIRQDTSIDDALKRKMRVIGRNAVPAFFQAFVEAITLGQADFPTTAIAKSPVFGAIGTAVAAAIAATLVSGLAAAIIGGIALAFGAGVLGVAFAAVMNDLDKEIGKFQSALADALEAGDVLIEPFRDAINLLTNSVREATPWLRDFFSIFDPVILPLAQGLVGFFEAMGPGLEAMGRVAADALLELAEALPGMGAALGDMFLRIEQDWPDIKQSIDEFLDDTVMVLKVLGEIFMWMATHYHELKAILKTLTVPPPLLFLSSDLPIKIGEALVRMLRAVRDFVLGWVESLTRLPGQSINAIGGLGGRLVAWAGGLVLTARSGASRLVQGFVGIVKDLPGRAMTAIGAIRGRLANFFGGAGTWLWNAGWRIIRGLVDGIQSAVNSILQPTLNWVTNMIPDWKGPPAKDADLLTENGRLIGKSLRDGMFGEFEGLMGDLGNFTVNLPGQIPAPRQPSDGGRGPVTVSVNIDARGATPDTAQKIGREAAFAIRKALDDLEVSLKR